MKKDLKERHKEMLNCFQFFRVSGNYFEVRRNYFGASDDYFSARRDYFDASDDYFEVRHDYFDASDDYFEVRRDYFDASDDYFSARRDYFSASDNYFEGCLSKYFNVGCRDSARKIAFTLCTITDYNNFFERLRVF
ncbi:MAG: hypothetical protein LBS79_00720 [Tannerella sp.]|jgi:DNA-binding transcriptional regulator GbsR (MarR family)|nr:hypothetical protein [Tannerella sp.]